MEPEVSCNDPNTTDACSCDDPTYSLDRWDENLITKFGIFCGEKHKLALPDLFFNIGVTFACFMGLLMNSFEVELDHN